MKCKSSYLLHPIFDAFLGLKWKRVSLPFYVHLSWTFAYTFIIMCYSLQRFSILKEVVPTVYGDLNIIECFMRVLLPESIIERIIGFGMAIHVISDYVQNSRRTSTQPCKGRIQLIRLAKTTELLTPPPIYKVPKVVNIQKQEKISLKVWTRMIPPPF